MNKNSLNSSPENLPIFTQEKIYLDTSIGNFEGVHYKPTGPKKGTIIYGLGWNSNSIIQKPMLEGLAANGYEVASVNPYVLFGDQRPDMENLGLPVEEAKAEGIFALFGYLKNQGINNFNVVLNSEAGIYGTLAIMKALQNPDLPKIDKLFRLSTAGEIEDESPAKLMWRFFVNERLKRLQQGDLNLIRRSQVIKTGMSTKAKELIEISSARMAENLKILQDNGIKLIYISAENDGVFPQKYLKKAAEELGAEFHSVRGTHRAIYTHTEDIIDIIDSIITA